MGQVQGGGQAHNQRHGQGAGPQAPLLAAAMELGGEREGPADRQGTDALGSIELVGAEAEQVDAQLGGLEGKVAHGLGAVAVEGDSPLAAEGADRGQGLEHADFVVGGHHAHHQGLGAQGRFELVQIHQAIAAHRQFAEPEAMAGQVAQGIEHGPVFRGQGHELAPAAARRQFRLGQALEGQVVGLGGAAGEDQLGVPLRAPGVPRGGSCREAQLLQDLAAGLVHGGGGPQAGPVQAAGWVGELLRPPGGHGGHHGRITGGGGLVVEVGEHGPMLTRAFCDGW